MQSTPRIDTAFNAIRDSCFLARGAGRFETRSRSSRIQEWRSARCLLMGNPKSRETVEDLMADTRDAVKSSR